MNERRGPAYGRPNWGMIGRWFELAPEDDGPFWALNLMRYRALADYGDGSSSGRTGVEADEAYAPLGPLAAIGAMVAFHGDVDEQQSGQPGWHRIGIVRYPSRAAFFAMQQRDDFKDQHVHKEAGMEFTIVMACHPVTYDESAASEGTLLLTVLPGGWSAPATPFPERVEPVATFDVEGVIVGDERTFEVARFDRVADDAALDAFVRWARSGDDVHQMVVTPLVDDLITSIASAFPVDGHIDGGTGA